MSKFMPFSILLIKMHTRKILCLLAIGLLCVNARYIKKQKKIRQRPASISSQGCLPVIEVPCKSILEPTYGGLGTCNCPNIFLDERASCGGCKYVKSYGVLSPEVSNYDRVPAIKLPKAIASYDAGVPIPAINLPGLYDLVTELPPCACQAIPPYVVDLPCTCQAIPPYVMDLPCSCQASLPSYQIIETPCKSMPPILDYLSPCDVPSPMLTVPFAEPYYMPPCKCQPQMIKMPSCGCPLPQIECGCQKTMPCACQNIEYGYPKTMPCACQNVVTCDNGYQVSYGLSCGCQNPLNCGCQNVIQLPAPCSCQACQLPAVELPVYGYGCQSLPSPDVCSGGKYLRQVTLQPPFL